MLHDLDQELNNESTVARSLLCSGTASIPLEVSLAHAAFFKPGDAGGVADRFESENVTDPNRTPGDADDEFFITTSGPEADGPGPVLGRLPRGRSPSVLELRREDLGPSGASSGLTDGRSRVTAISTCEG